MLLGMLCLILMVRLTMGKAAGPTGVASEMMNALEKKGRVYASCVRSSMTYGSETRSLLCDVGLKCRDAVCILKTEGQMKNLESSLEFSISQLSLGLSSSQSRFLFSK